MSSHEYRIVVKCVAPEYANNAFDYDSEDLWKTAVAYLGDEDKAGLHLDVADANKLDVITQCLKLATEAENKCKAKAWKFRRRDGGEVIARDVFAKVARWINHFRAVGDTIVQYDPVHAALPWAGVCVDYFGTHDFLLEKIAHIAEQICRCELIEKHLIRPPSPTIDELRRALVKLYAAILTFLFNGAFQAIITAQTETEYCSQMASAQEQLDRLAALKAELASLEKPMTRWSEELAKITDGLDRSRRTDILRWVSREPYLQYHKRERETFLEGTGQWLISNSVFQKWKDESASSFLWLHGIPGSGKSKLTYVIYR
ncbi:hypothetical protein ONZ43_g1044 [Nemania bipapillata]|uniref:Uncharacterized protein n=1 Tax=Nemania bipapillata TaxID=110536 RepID=A0ACC2J602_9PEZI|nr:hypothetical protein ONZ43_g1044 [Nemania bipapillata]